MRLVNISCFILLLFVALEVSASGNKKNNGNRRQSSSSTSNSQRQPAPQGSQSSGNSQRPSTSQGSQSSSNSQRPHGSQSSPNRATTKKRCKFSMHSDVKSQHPLLLTPGRMTTDFLYPDSGNSHKIRLQPNSKMMLACPGKDNFIRGLPLDRRVSSIEVDCEADKIFSINTRTFSIGDIDCNLPLRNIARRTQMRCHRTAKHVEIGFDLVTKFFPTIDVCWDEATLTTYWTKFSLTPTIKALQHSDRPRFWEGRNLYGTLDISIPYAFDVQLKTMETLVGSAALAKQYINNENDNKLFITRGHMTARNDFVYGAAQMSTFWYLNQAPQWHCFNEGNWGTLEYNIRYFVSRRNSPLIIYTGTHGQMSVKDVNGASVPFYLHVDGNKRAFPVPKYFWKVIYDPLTKEGTAFVGVNDPWATINDEGIQICNDISTSISWLTWQADDPVLGLSYACDVNELKLAVPTVPGIVVRNTLF